MLGQPQYLQPSGHFLVRVCPPQTTMPLGVGYLGLGRLTAFSETSTKPVASNIKANLTLVTFTKYSFILRVIIAEHTAKLHKLAAIRVVDIGASALIDDDEVDMLGNFMTFTRAHHFTALSYHCCSAFKMLPNCEYMVTSM
jgi:hypothetical protein